jgi:hypothetical protein
MSTKIKFITSIYSDLYGTEYGGRMVEGVIIDIVYYHY